ncbi:MAG: N-acetylmuramoyl-L-alanine amidase [Thermoanaerobaculia bacterium]
MLAATAGGTAAGAAVERAKVAPGRYALLVDKQEIYLQVAPEAGDGWHAFARRWTGSPTNATAISKANRNARRPLAGVSYRIPFDLLLEDVKLAVVRALFPKDQSGVDGWTHWTRGESTDEVARWFTGGRAAAVSLRKTQGLKSGRLASGTRVLVPNDLLDGIFRYVPPAIPPPVSASAGAAAPTATGAASRPAIVAPVAPDSAEAPLGSLLDYGEDAGGGFAIYRLRPGEALYSSVIVRFTGRLEAEDVNALAMDVARRSGIVDVTDIPIGFPVKIPLDILLPEFLPEKDPRRLEYEVEQTLASGYKNVVEARGLEGVTVVIDPGHGGVDVGASMSGVWESNYVYDIAVRVKRRLELDSRAKVHLTTRDGAEWAILDRDVLPYARGHAVLTHPPFPITDTIIGVNLRWYLANSILRQVKEKGGSPDRVVFLSIHADSLHPSIRGATIYVPDSAGSDAPFRKSGAAFTSRKEVREQPTVSFSSKERQRSEGLSRDLAENTISVFRRRDLAVHPFKPVRDRIYRGKRAWVPAVLRYNAIPAKMLLEVCNLANPEDRKLLTSRAFREEMAKAVVEGLRRYFKETG